MSRWRLHRYTLLVVILLSMATTQANGLMSKSRKRELRELTRDTFNHAYRNYKRVAFPADELLPLSCKPQGHDRIQSENVAVNDVMGDYALTLVDSLDSFAVMGDRAGFEMGVRETIQHVQFDLDSRIQVFEVVIRMLGGLLSAHQLAIDPHFGFALSWYKDELLVLARDLGRRLLPSFNTPTGIPYPRIHLQRGVRNSETLETCTAGAGSLLLEMGTLSRLTGDPSFEVAARKSFYALWSRRSDLDLVGNTINIATGQWLHGVSSTGAGIDSFFEYAAKAFILFGEDEWYRVWEEAYSSILRYIRAPDGFWYRGVNMQTGQLATVVVDSLSAFFPGVQTLMGDLESAIKSHAVYAFQWKRYGGLPETFDINQRKALHLGYPLRPEFIESNLFLYRATKDEFYLELAEQILHDLNNRTRVACGLAAVFNLSDGTLEDKQPSFVTSETLKYLYLTFDEDNPFNRIDSNMIFSTEGHMLQVDARPLPNRRRKTIAVASPTCPRYDPFAHQRAQHFLSPSIATRTDFEYARNLVGYEIKDEAREIREGRWSPSGFCAVSTLEDYRAEIVFGAVEDTAPSRKKVYLDSSGLVVINVIEGLRFTLTRSLTGEGFRVSKVSNLKVIEGASVIIRDPTVLNLIPVPPLKKAHLTLSINNRPLLRAPAYQASFGPSISSEPMAASSVGEFRINRPGLPVITSAFKYGCEPYRTESIFGKVVIVRRGMCPFLTKSNQAALGGAKAIIVVNSLELDDVIPSADRIEVAATNALVPLLLVGNATGATLERILLNEATNGREMILSVEATDVSKENEPINLAGYVVSNVRLKRT